MTHCDAHYRRGKTQFIYSFPRDKPYSAVYVGPSCTHLNIKLYLYVIARRDNMSRWAITLLMIRRGARYILENYERFVSNISNYENDINRELTVTECILHDAIRNSIFMLWCIIIIIIIIRYLSRFSGIHL